MGTKRITFIPGKLYRFKKNGTGNIRESYFLWRKNNNLTAVVVPVDAPIMFIGKNVDATDTNNKEYWFLYNGQIGGWKNNLALTVFEEAIKRKEEEED